MMTILSYLPTGADYAAKPTHFSSLGGVGLVRHDKEKDVTRFSGNGRELEQGALDEVDVKEAVAATLAKHLHSEANQDGGLDFEESWALRNVQPGIVVEELFTHVDDGNVPPMEFNIFTIWGRVWIGQMNEVEGQNRYNTGFFYRNGTAAPQETGAPKIPDYVDWPQLVGIAEWLGAHKDMFRTDIFVGVPSSARVETKQDRVKALRVAVSESEIYPTTIFWDKEVCDEGARLWIAGYKMGNYRTVENTEVPEDFLNNGYCTLPGCGIANATDDTEDAVSDSDEEDYIDSGDVYIHVLSHFSAKVQINWLDPSRGILEEVATLGLDEKTGIYCNLGDVFEILELSDHKTGKCLNGEVCRRALLQVDQNSSANKQRYRIMEDFEVVHVTALTYTWTDFVVAGVNLAQYELEGELVHQQECTDNGEDSSGDHHHFELFEDFNIAHLIEGHESFFDLIKLKGSVQKPTLSFYEDKVAIKRWLPENSFSIPGLYALNYNSELTCGMQEQGLLSLLPNQTEAMLGLLPTGRSEYVAKPSHKAESHDVWVVRLELGNNNGTTIQVCMDNGPFKDAEDFHPSWVADSLARALYERPDEWEAWANFQVKPGVIVEERFASPENGKPYEFKFFTM